MFRKQICICTVILLLALNIAVSLPRNFKSMIESLSGWSLTGSMNMPRTCHAATSLSDGQILVSGGMLFDGQYYGMLGTSEVYDLARRCWLDGLTSMSIPRAYHALSLLLDGKVLVSGGLSCILFVDPSTCVVTNIAEFFDPIQGRWVQTGNMQNEREMHTASVLSNGKVLVTGGANFEQMQWDTCELYDPVTEEWTRTSNMHEARSTHTATVLQDGKVLIVGGTIDSSAKRATNGCELYDPLTGNWTKIASMNVARSGHTATLFKNGQVLIVGGSADSGGATSSCELYNPSTDTWAVVGDMHDSRLSFTASLLPNGKVLVAGGGTGMGYDCFKSTELYDPTTRNWTKADDMLFPIGYHTASVLRNGDVLVTGGYSNYEGSVAPTKLSMQYNSSMNAVTSSNIIAKLPASRQIFMSTDGKVSATVEDKFKTVNNTQLH